jgi:hypothetical protein
LAPQSLAGLSRGLFAPGGGISQKSRARFPSQCPSPGPNTNTKTNPYPNPYPNPNPNPNPWAKCQRPKGQGQRGSLAQAPQGPRGTPVGGAWPWANGPLALAPRKRPARARSRQFSGSRGRGRNNPGGRGLLARGWRKEPGRHFQDVFRDGPGQDSGQRGIRAGIGDRPAGGRAQPGEG